MRVKFRALAATAAVSVAAAATTGGIRGTVGDDSEIVDGCCGFVGIWDGEDGIGGFQRECTVDDIVNCGCDGR